MLKLIGASASPFVRKVRVALAEKGIAYEHDPMVPFGQPPEYLQISPLGKIPALLDDGKPLSDSSIIIAYLERKHPSPSLYPQEPYEFARSLWFEEYGDSALVQNLTAPIFFQRVIAPRFFNRPTDEAVVQKAIEVEAPKCLDYLEAQIDDKEFLAGGQFSVADIGITTHFVNARFADYSVDAQRWPKVAAYLGRMLSRPSFRDIVKEEAAAFGIEM
ncbi:MAG: glutathione S-transferase family protein [Candidatus Binatia bacterium]